MTREELMSYLRNADSQKVNRDSSVSRGIGNIASKIKEKYPAVKRELRNALQDVGQAYIDRDLSYGDSARVLGSIAKRAGSSIGDMLNTIGRAQIDEWNAYKDGLRQIVGKGRSGSDSSSDFDKKVNRIIADRQKDDIREVQKELYSQGYVDMYDTLHNIRNKDDVKALQSVLAKKGYLKGSNAIDGIIGKNTRDALKRFASDRKSQDLDYLVYKYAVDGKYGKKTEAALRRMSTDIADNGELPDEYIEKYARPSMFERLEVVDNPLPSGQQYIARRERNASMLGLPQVNRQIPGYTDLSDINGIGNWRVNPNVKSAEVVDDIDYIEDALDDMNPDMYL